MKFLINWLYTSCSHLCPIILFSYSLINAESTVWQERPISLIPVDNVNCSIHQAALLGDLHAIKAYIESGLNIDVPNEQGQTPLHCAAKAGNAHVALFLVEQGANINAVDNNGLTPLHIASHYNKLPIVALLINHGASKTKLDRLKQTVLHHAVLGNGSAELIQLVVDTTSINSINVFGNSPLLLAIALKRSTQIPLLIELGADIHLKNNRGTCAYTWCLKHPNDTFASYIINHHAALAKESLKPHLNQTPTTPSQPTNATTTASLNYPLIAAAAVGTAIVVSIVGLAAWYYFLKPHTAVS